MEALVPGVFVRAGAGAYHQSVKLGNSRRYSRREIPPKIFVSSAIDEPETSRRDTPRYRRDDDRVDTKIVDIDEKMLLS